MLFRAGEADCFQAAAAAGAPREQSYSLLELQPGQEPCLVVLGHAKNLLNPGTGTEAETQPPSC